MTTSAPRIHHRGDQCQPANPRWLGEPPSHGRVHRPSNCRPARTAPPRRPDRRWRTAASRPSPADRTRVPAVPAVRLAPRHVQTHALQRPRRGSARLRAQECLIQQHQRTVVHAHAMHEHHGQPVALGHCICLRLSHHTVLSTGIIRRASRRNALRYRRRAMFRRTPVPCTQAAAGTVQPRRASGTPGAGRGDHQHAVVGTKHLVVDVHADHGEAAPHRLGPLLHRKNRLVARPHQLLFIALAASAEHVAQAGADILEHVDAGKRLHRTRCPDSY